MPRKIPNERREEILRLYDNGNGLSTAEIEANKYFLLICIWFDKSKKKA